MAFDPQTPKNGGLTKLKALLLSINDMISMNKLFHTT
jgi:hypothetical protein